MVREIYWIVVDGFHVDKIVPAHPSRLELWHDGDWVLLAARDETVRVRFYAADARYHVDFPIHLTPDKLVLVRVLKRRREAPENWSAIITFTDPANRPPRALRRVELEKLKVAWAKKRCCFLEGLFVTLPRIVEVTSADAHAKARVARCPR